MPTTERFTPMLTFLSIKGLKPKSKQYDVADVPGLFLRVNPSGKKVWRINKSVKGKRIVRQLGEYPTISLQDARKALEDLTTPIVTPTVDNTFNGIYKDWLDLKKRSIKNWSDIDERMQKYILPYVGQLPMSLVTPPQLIKLLKDDLEKRNKLETIKRICGYIKEIETFAVNSGRVESMKFQGLQKVFASPGTRLANRPSIPPQRLPEILPLLQAETLKARTTWDTIQIAFYTLLRPIEYCSMEWEWIHDGVIEVPAEVMKMKKPHLVPITRQLEKVLSDRPQVSDFVLTSPDRKDCHIRTAAQEVFFRRHGLKGILVPHGIRAIGRTWMHENGINNDVAEMCLAHRVGTRVTQAYDRTDLLEERREAMQKWCDFVESCLKQRS